jgi:hypothetical protein
MRPTFFFAKKKVGKEKALAWVIYDNRLCITKFDSLSLRKKVVERLLRRLTTFMVKIILLADITLASHFC